LYALLIMSNAVSEETSLFGAVNACVHELWTFRFNPRYNQSLALQHTAPPYVTA
jgi:hypothetical protein